MLEQPAVADQGDVIGDGRGFVTVVGDHQDGRVQFLPDLRQQLAHGVPQFGVQGAEGFIEQQHRRARAQCPGDSYPLLLPAGKFCHRPRARSLHLDQIQEGRRIVSGLLAWRAAHGRCEGHVVEHVQVREQQRTLKDHRHAAPFRADRGKILSVQHHTPAVEGFKDGDGRKESQ